MFMALTFLALTCVATSGCGGSDTPTVTGAGDPEGVAAYEELMAEQQAMTPEEMKKMEKEMNEKK